MTEVAFNLPGQCYKHVNFKRLRLLNYNELINNNFNTVHLLKENYKAPDIITYWQELFLTF